MGCKQQTFITTFLQRLSTVLFEIELLSYIDHKAADDYEAFTEVSLKYVRSVSLIAYMMCPTRKISLMWYSLYHNKFIFHQACSVKIHGLLTKCEFKMAGCCPNSVFAGLCTLTPSCSIIRQKKELGQCQAILISHLVNNQ